MTGFQSFDEAGNVQVSSEMKSILVQPATATTLFADSNAGYWLSPDTPLLSGVSGRVNRLYGLRSGNTLFTSDPTKSYWVRIPNGGAFCRIDRFFGANAGTNYKVLVGTNRSLNHVSGYLDVYKADGSLAWSAASAGSVPRIDGVFSATRNQLWDKVGGASITIPGEPYFMVSSLVGWSEQESSSTGELHGVSLFRSGDTYYVFADFYSSGMSYAQAKAGFSPDGVRIPYATILGA